MSKSSNVMRERERENLLLFNVLKPSSPQLQPIIICHSSYENCPQTRPVTAAIHRVLERAGFLILSVWADVSTYMTVYVGD